MMVCPYCKNKMDEGSICSRDRMIWCPKDKKRGVMQPMEYEVLLSSPRFLVTAEIPVYRCSQCGIELIVESCCDAFSDGCIV